MHTFVDKEYSPSVRIIKIQPKLPHRR